MPDKWYSIIRDTNEVEGGSLSNPGEIGYLYSASAWSVAVLNFERGEEAYSRIYDHNANNRQSAGMKLKEGKEYLCLYVRVKRIRQGVGGMTVGVWDHWCKIMGDKRTLHDMGPTVYGMLCPEPTAEAELLVGGETEGWITRECFEGESGLVAYFEIPNDWDELIIALD